MTNISPITFRGITSSAAPTGVQKSPENLPEAYNMVDLTDKYSQKEINEILKRIGTDNKSGYPCRYSVEFLPKAGAMVINNMNMTNDTTEILKDGRVRHCGSWHNKEVAPEGSFTDIIEDAKKRMEDPSYRAK